MQSDRELWPLWSHILRYDGVKGLISFLLEASGPLPILLAQVIYLGQPLFGRAGSTGQLNALAELLEDREETRSFAVFLREEKLQ